MNFHNYTNRSTVLKTLAAVLTLGIVGVQGHLNAQENDEGSIFELSPFSVDESQDSGYMAINTLAGTRLNSSLSDVAAAISPFTKQFIEDIGADSVEQLLEYSNNTVRMDETELANTNGPIEFEFRFNIRGLPASRSRNYFIWDDISTDNFNVARIEESRGPNSILFGVGSAGGIINSSTKQARFYDINEVQVMFGSHAQFRSTVDFNRVLIEDKLALRVNVMTDETDTWRNFEFKDQQRVHLAATYKAGENTTLRAEAEWGDIQDNLARSYLGTDFTSEWIAAGMPDRSESTANTRNRRNANVYVDNDKRVLFTGTNGGYLTNIGGRSSQIIGEESDLLKWKANPGGPDNIRNTDYTTYSIYLEQRFGDNFNLEVAYNHQSSYFLQYDSGGGAYDLRGDVSDPSLGDEWAARSGEFFYENTWSQRWRDRTADTFRATASYELELPDYWGYHRFAAMYEDRDSTSARASNFEQLGDSNGVLLVPIADGAQSTNGQNRVWRRHYITPGDFDTYHASSWRTPVSVNRNGTTYSSIWAPANLNVSDDWQNLSSKLISMQNFWFDRKVVTTYGYREDDIMMAKRGITQDPVNNQFVVDYANPAEIFNFSGGTTTLGIVVKPTDWLSIIYNDSDNQGLPDVNHVILPNGVPDPSDGEGNDIGLMLNLMDGRFSARFARFESSMIGLTSFGNTANVENPNERILDVLLDAGLIDDAERASRNIITNTYTFARATEGYEAQITANFTDNLSLRLNYSITDRVRSMVMPEVLTWFSEQNAFWRSFPDNVFNNIGDEGPGTGPYTPATGRDSIAEEVARVTEYIELQTAVEGIGDAGSRKYNGNLFTNYRFTEGVLKGFNIGGGIRYLGPLTVNVDVPTATLIWGNDKTLVDFLVGYRTKLTDKVDISYQLNVKNLFDDREITIAGRQLDGRLARIALQAPQEFQFRTSLNW